MAETKLTGLKPCPFCGTTEPNPRQAVGKGNTVTMYWIECRSCLTDGPYCSDAMVAKDAWNHRAPETQRDDLLKAAHYTVNMLNAYTECPGCGFKENDRSGQRHSDDCPAAVLAVAIAKAEGAS